jgi:disulfide bond formation protein DsbB
MYLTVGVISVASIKFDVMRYMLLLTVFLELSFGLYHLGVENHWWIGPQSCVAELPTLESSMSSNVFENTKTYCDRVNWTIFGISSTLWNFLLSAFIFWLVSVSYILDLYLRKIKNE